MTYKVRIFYYNYTNRSNQPQKNFQTNSLYLETLLHVALLLLLYYNYRYINTKPTFTSAKNINECMTFYLTESSKLETS